MRSKRNGFLKEGNRRKLVLAFILSAGALVFFVGCAKTSADKLGGGSTGCDTTVVQYSVQVVNILQQNCYECHGTGNTGGSGGIDLGSYTKLKVYADNGYLVGNVTHNPDPKYTPMPYGKAKLPDCEVNTIVAWVNQGALNN